MSPSPEARRPEEKDIKTAIIKRAANRERTTIDAEPRHTLETVMSVDANAYKQELKKMHQEGEDVLDELAIMTDYFPEEKAKALSERINEEKTLTEMPIEIPKAKWDKVKSRVDAYRKAKEITERLDTAA